MNKLEIFKMHMQRIKDKLNELCEEANEDGIDLFFSLATTMFDIDKDPRSHDSYPYGGFLSNVEDQVFSKDHLLQNEEHFKILLEKQRFKKQFKNTEKFFVTCIDHDNIGIDFSNGGDWVKKGCFYLVEKVLPSQSGFCFILRDFGSGEILIPPSPYQGFHSSRFIPSQMLVEN